MVDISKGRNSKVTGGGRGMGERKKGESRVIERSERGD